VKVFCLPDLGEGLADAEIVRWRVEAGDQVAVDQVVVEVETAKAAVELPCPYAGTVSVLHGSAGEIVAVGAPLVTIEPADTPARQVLVGSGPVAAAPRRRRRGRWAGGSAPEDRLSIPAQLVDGRPHRADSAAGPVSAAGADAVRVLSPIVRRLAHDHGVDVRALAGSGPGGIVVRADVQQAIDAAGPNRPAPSMPAPSMPAPSMPGAFVAGPSESAPVRVPLRGTHRAMADAVARAHHDIPDACTWVDVDATGLLAARQELRAAYPDERIGVLALLARICVAGLRRFPELNATIEGDEVVHLPGVNLGFAAQTDRGLVVPVVHAADRRTTLELAQELTRLTTLARNGSLTPADLTGGTFTLNNYGVYGVDGATPIIRHPEAAMLGVGRIAAKPWVVGGELAVREVAQLSLTFDHRVCDGGVAGRFLRFVADATERPVVLLGLL
jgi:2-oxoisovalerate dehydrogenase E2 component (dihydrolipoyl transacylase)